MRAKKYPIILLLILMAGTVAFSQQQRVVIRGRVIDKKDRTGIVGANIIEYDKNNRVINGTACDVNGDFVLEMKNMDDVVKVSIIGYISKTVFVDPTRLVTIELEQTVTQLKGVTVTGRKRGEHRLTNIEARDNASSSVKVDMSDMKEIGVLSAADVLQAKVSGVDILAASGDPGSGSQLVIRGLSSMGNAKPLIVIDGIPQFAVPAEFNLAAADQQDISNLVNIPIQDIKSIEVLKDAASTAIYGSKGADGVLLIETNQGRMGKVQFDYSYKTSLNIQPPAIPMLNGNEYIMLQLEELHNSLGVFQVPEEIAYDRDYADFYNYSANTDWIKAITKNAFTNDHFFSISGGGEKTRYYTSISYVNEGGTTINTSSKRFSTRVNLDYYLSKKLLFTVNFNYTNNKTDNNLTINNMNIREMAYIKAPNMSIWQYDANGFPTGEYFTPITSYQGQGSSYFNPVAVANLGKNSKVANSLFNAFTLSYNILDWLVFRETLSVQYEGSKQNIYLPYNAIGEDWLQWNINMAEESNGLASSIQTETYLGFMAPFDSAHVLSGSLNWLTDQPGWEWMDIQSNKTPSTSIQDPAINAQINWIGDGSQLTRQLGALMNLNYKYKDKYMLQTVLRADAHSSFGSNHRWGLFKGVSAGWRFSKEPFLSSLTFLGESKLRLSWGLSGRQPTNPYARFANYITASNGGYMTFPGLIPFQPALDNLQWESVSQTNLGLDLNLLKDRLSITGEIYNKITTNILFPNYKIPSSAGYDSLLFFNGGKLQNKGWELMLDYRIIQKKNFRWSVNFNISHNINAFLALPSNFNIEQSTSIGNGEYPKRIQMGQSIGSFFGFKYLGVYASDADAVAHDAQGNIIHDATGAPLPMTYLGSYTFKGGDPIYADINHDGKIDLNDVVYLGNSSPQYIGGFGSAVKYKGFELACQFHYRFGYDIINGVAIETQGMNNKNNQSKATLSRWRAQGQNEPGLLPRAYMNSPANNLGSDRYVEKGGFVRLLNVQLTYRLNQGLCDKLRVRSLAATLSARKIFTLTNYSGQDPEVGQDASNPFWIGVDNAKTPPPRLITLNFLIGF